MYAFTYQTLFTLKLEPPEAQDAAKKANFEFWQLSPPSPLIRVFSE